MLHAMLEAPVTWDILTMPSKGMTAGPMPIIYWHRSSSGVSGQIAIWPVMAMTAAVMGQTATWLA